MRGAGKGIQERILILAHQIESAARHKRLPELDKWLKPKGSGKAEGASVAAGLKAMEKRGMNVRVKRIERTDRKD